MSLPPKVIQGWSVRDYAYLWICGHCELHQWCSGAKAIDSEVIAHVKNEIVNVHLSLLYVDEDFQPEDKEGLIELLQYLIHNEGAPAELYVPDQWADSAKADIEAGDRDILLRGIKESQNALGNSTRGHRRRCH